MNFRYIVSLFVQVEENKCTSGQVDISASLAFDQATAKPGNLPQRSFSTDYGDLRIVDAVANTFAHPEFKK